MGTKVKGLIKGIKKNLSQQFQDDDKEPEIQIGQPTDVKHVAHIGGDGAAVESPSWMKGFEASTGTQSGPLEDSGRKGRRDDSSSHRSTRSVETSRDLPLLPRSTRQRHHSMDNDLDSESFNKDSSSSKPRHSRRKGRRSSQEQDAINAGDTDARKKSSRRRKSKSKSKSNLKEESSGEGSTRSTTKSTADESDLGSDDV